MPHYTNSWIHRGRRTIVGSVLVICGCGTNFVRTPIGDAWQQSGSAPAEPHHFERVLIIVLENENYERAMADSYLAGLAARGASFTDFHALFHPSYSNYLAMVAGKEIVTHYDRQLDLEDRSIADLLKAKGLTWKNYAEGYPGHCFTGETSGRYARKHVPFVSFKAIRNRSCENIVGGDRFAEELKAGALPNYAFYSPDLYDDGHDTGVAYASRWLEGFLDPLLRSPAFMKASLVVVTFDESDGSGSDPNHIYTVFLGDMVKAGAYGGNYNHYNVLRTVEENFGLGALGDGDGRAKRISGVWK